MAIIPDAFTTGFEEHMSTFSQEVRALNPGGIVVAGCGLCQFRMLWLEPWEGHLWQGRRKVFYSGGVNRPARFNKRGGGRCCPRSLYHFHVAGNLIHYVIIFILKASLYGLIYFVTSLLIPPFLRYYFV